MGRRTIPFAILFFCCFTTLVLGQEAIEISRILEDDKDISIRDMSRVNRKVVVSDTLRGWNLRWFGGFNGAQAAYRNWSHGGTNTISITATNVFNVYYRKDRFAYALATNFRYGKARLEKKGTRKTDDRFAINNKFSYLFQDENWSAFGNLNFSTQFDKGYKYNVPEGEDPRLISKFFAPAYFTQIVGISYAPAGFFNAEAGLALKETIVSDTALSTRYGLDPGQTLRFEPGYSLALNFQKEIFTNVKLISNVETFTNLQEQFSSTDVSFSNEVIGRINDFMNMSFQFVLIYDEDFSKKVQLKQVLSAGVSFNIL